MIQIYGPARSSSGRCYLTLEEIGLPYKEVPIDMMGKREHKSESFLKLNPNGKVPCLVDGEIVLWESIAINFYLAEKYKPELLGQSIEDKALVRQWSIWSQTELQPPLVDMLIQMLFTPEDKKDPKVMERSREIIPAKLAILDKALNGRAFVVGDKFTLADLNVASVVNIVISLQMSLAAFENVDTWFSRIKDRPAFQRLLGMRTPNKT